MVVKIAKTQEGNHIRIHDKNYVGQVVLTRRNTYETIVHIYDDGRKEKAEPQAELLPLE